MAESPPPPESQGAAPLVRGAVPRLPVSRQYKFGLFAVAVVMLLLPVLYILITCGVMFAVYAFASSHSRMMESHYGYQQALFLAVLISGSILALFMLKPLFFKFWQTDKGFELRRADAPEFHQFVAAVSNALGVPPPKVIRIDLQPNAGARFRRDLLFLRGEPILIIGLPLLLALTTQQMAGVIAHDVCHLSQRMAMRLRWIIRTVNYWLAYAIYGPHL